MIFKEITYHLGKLNRNLTSVKAYDSLILDFIGDFGINLIKNKESNKFADLITLAFWCRKRKINEYKKFQKFNILGRGLIFHITPSNIPTNFIYSLLISLICGNSNIVKIPKIKFEQTKIIITELKKLLLKKKYINIRSLICLISYNNQDEVTNYLNSISNARMLWGSDKTVNLLKTNNKFSRLLDINFPDRFSISLINSDKLNNNMNKVLNNLISGFYNETYLSDQGACSSPQLILWYGKNFIKAQNIFWKSLSNFVDKNYNIPKIGPLDKFLLINKNYNENFKILKTYSDKLQIVSLKKLSSNQHEIRGQWGLFYQYNLNYNISQITKLLSSKYQTLTYFGFKKSFFKKNFFKQASLKGLDRIVPVGNALELDFNWDGYDLHKFLTREITIR